MAGLASPSVVASAATKAFPATAAIPTPVHARPLPSVHAANEVGPAARAARTKRDADARPSPRPRSRGARAHARHPADRCGGGGHADPADEDGKRGDGAIQRAGVDAGAQDGRAQGHQRPGDRQPDPAADVDQGMGEGQAVPGGQQPAGCPGGEHRDGEEPGQQAADHEERCSGDVVADHGREPAARVGCAPLARGRGRARR